MDDLEKAQALTHRHYVRAVQARQDAQILVASAATREHEIEALAQQRDAEETERLWKLIADTVWAAGKAPAGALSPKEV